MFAEHGSDGDGKTRKARNMWWCFGDYVCFENEGIHHLHFCRVHGMKESHGMQVRNGATFLDLGRDEAAAEEEIRPRLGLELERKERFSLPKCLLPWSTWPDVCNEYRSCSCN